MNFHLYIPSFQAWLWVAAPLAALCWLACRRLTDDATHPAVVFQRGCALALALGWPAILWLLQLALMALLGVVVLGVAACVGWLVSLATKPLWFSTRTAPNPDPELS